MPESVEILRLFKDAQIPERAHPEDAGLDLKSRESFVIGPGQSKLVSTGIAVALPRQTFGMIADRSSMALKGLKTAGGIIDQGYRGEVKVILWNISLQEHAVNIGDRIAQIIILPVSLGVPIEVSVLDATGRATGGFGSTGL